MVQQNTLLVMLLQLVDRIPIAPSPAKRGKGRPSFYPDTLFLKALVIMIIKHLHSPYELLCVLEQPTAEITALRSMLTQDGRYPTRRTWERRLASLPNKLPAQIGALGRHLVELIQPWSTCGRAVAADSTVLRARGGVWHKKHRLRGEVPHTLIDTEAEKLLVELPSDVHYMLGDQHYNTPSLRALCVLRGWWLVATHRGKQAKTDTGKEVRRIFHKLRSVAMENFNQHFKGIFGGNG